MLLSSKVQGISIEYTDEFTTISSCGIFAPQPSTRVYSLGSWLFGGQHNFCTSVSNAAYFHYLITSCVQSLSLVMLQPKIESRNVVTGIKANHMSSNSSPQSFFQSPGSQNAKGQQESIVFGVSMNGSAAWDATSLLGDIQNIWSIDTGTMSDIVFTTDWLESNDVPSMIPNPPVASFPYNTLIHQHSSNDISQSSISDADIQPISTGTQKTRRQAQNRAAQRAYRARKEDQLERSRLKIMELEKEVQRLQRILDLKPRQWSEMSDVSALHNKISALEIRNKILESEYQELNLRLHRTAATLLEPGMNG